MSGNENWGYYMGHEEGGKQRVCGECFNMVVEYWHDHKQHKTVCSKCSDGMKPGSEKNPIKRREVVCQHCKRLTAA